MKYSLELIRLLAVILITFTHTKHNLTEGWVYILVEKIPKFGTVILSIVSGYLYWTITKDKPNLFSKKVKSLVIPYLIANIVVLLPVVLAYFILDVNFLNRLTFDYSLLTNGLFSLNAAPVNPPTYFIRDIFIVFVLIELLFRKNWKMLFIIIPLLFFGKLMIRYDILLLFVMGALFANYKDKLNKPLLLLFFAVSSILIGYYFATYTKYFVSAFLFLLLVDWKIKFYKTGGFSYLLHLYHAPIIILSYPLLAKYIDNVYWNLVAQISIVMVFIYLFYLLTRKVKLLRILSGGR